MKHTSLNTMSFLSFRPLCALCLVGFTLLHTGCGGGGTIPDTRVAPTTNAAIDATKYTRYTLYADVPTADEIVAENGSNPPTWNQWETVPKTGQYTVSGNVLDNRKFPGSGTADLPNAYEFKPTPAIWGWGVSFGADAKFAANLSMFATSGHLQFDIKPNNYPGKIEVGFQLNTLDNVTVYAFVQLFSGSGYGYISDGQWHHVSIPITDILKAAKVGLDPLNTVDLTMVVSSFVIADRFAKTGKADKTTGLPSVYVDKIYISKD